MQNQKGLGRNNFLIRTQSRLKPETGTTKIGDGNDWNDWEYYFGPIMTGCWENIPAMQEKGKAKGGKFFRGMSK